MTLSDTSAQQPQAIRIANVYKSYGDHPVLKNIDAEVARGEVVVICGPSGSGKSTLIRTINRLEEISSGVIRKPPPTPNMPDRNPTAAPMPRMMKIFTESSAMGR